MADFNSKYSGEQVETMLDQIANGEAGGGGGIAVETDPIFSASPAASITTEKISAWDDKEDKPIIFDVDKAGIQVGDGEEYFGEFTSEQFQLATGMAFTEFYVMLSNGKKVVLKYEQFIIEPEAILARNNGVLVHFTSQLAQIGFFLQCSSEQMSLVRMAILESVFQDFYTKEEIDTNKQDKLVSGTNIKTINGQSILGSGDIEIGAGGDTSGLSERVDGLETTVNTLVSGNASTAIESFNEITAFLDGIEDSENLDNIIASIEQQIAGKMDKVTLAAVATSGSYNDLSDKPTIPAAVTESTVSGWGFTKNTGTVTKVKINGNEKTPDANGLVDLGTIEGGTASSTGNYPVITVYDTESINLSPNTYYINKIDLVGMPNIDITLNREEEITGQVNEYIIEINLFDTFGNEPIPCSFPEEIIWANESIPTFVAGHAYVISIVNNLAVFAEF